LAPSTAGKTRPGHQLILSLILAFFGFDPRQQQRAMFPQNRGSTVCFCCFHSQSGEFLPCFLNRHPTNCFQICQSLSPSRFRLTNRFSKRNLTSAFGTPVSVQNSPVNQGEFFGFAFD
jgi:hypothetical protein